MRNWDEKTAQKRAGILQIAGLPEGEKSAPLWVGFRVIDDDVIDQFDLENLGGITPVLAPAEPPRRGYWKHHGSQR